MGMSVHLLAEMKRDYPYGVVIAGYGGELYTKRKAGNAHWIFSVHFPYVHRKPLVTKGKG